jgi:septum formation protein
MLKRLAGRTHQVCTGVALRRLEPTVEERFHVISNVTFLPLDESGIRAYLSKIDPLDKAGGYAAQEHRETIIARIEGSFSNVVGLPMERLLPILRQFG